MNYYRRHSRMYIVQKRIVVALVSQKNIMYKAQHNNIIRHKKILAAVKF
jgi:hypothetical protein